MKRLFIFVMLLGLVAGTTMAQELTTGTLEGMVTDEDGNRIEGAIITVMGPQGVQVTETNKNGAFVVRGLGSGTYKVKCEAANFAPVVQTDVKIFINRKTQLPFTLTAGMTEEVTVVSQAPLVDMKSTGTGATIAIDDLMPYVPIGRNLTSVYNIAPGVSDGGDPTLGNTNPSISGSSGLENAYFVDGVNITNSGYGAIGAYSIVYGSLGSGVTYDFLEEVQVKTGGFEAEWGQASGGVVNAVVRTGTNTFGFDVAWYQTVGALNGDWGQRGDSPNWGNSQEFERQDIALSVQGPILKDKLFYFVAYNPVTTDQQFSLTSGNASNQYFIDDTNGDGQICDTSGACSDPGSPNLGPDTPSTFEVGEVITGQTVPQTTTRTRTIENYAAKFSWFATANHKIEFSAFGDPSDGDVGAQNPTAFLRVLSDPILNPDPAASATGLDWGGDQYTLKYQGVWSPNFFTEIQYAHKENNFEEAGPGVNFRSFFDTQTTNTAGGAGFFEFLTDEVDQYSFKNTHVFGNVELKYGASYEDIGWAQPRQYSGPAYNGIYPNLTDFLVDTTNDGVGDTQGSGYAQGVCADPTNTADPGCYTAVLSTTGAAVDFTPGVPGVTQDLFDVVRTEYAPVGEATNATETGFFAQVGWDIASNFTLKLGARYTEQELTGSGFFTLPMAELLNQQTVGTGLGAGTVLTAQSYKFDPEIAPRIGFAWDVANNGKYKVYGNYAEYYNRVPSDLAVRAFSNEVGTTSETFLDADLTMPTINATCNIDLNGNGLIDFNEIQAGSNCHGNQTVQGLAGGGSIILDGTQLDPTSDVYAALGGNHTLTTSEATKLPSTEEMLLGFAWELNDFTSFEVRWIDRQLGRVLEDVQFASNEQTWNLFWGAAGGNQATGDPFPGHGSGAFGAYVFANVGGNIDTTQFPLPSRDYTAFEFIFNRRFRNNWMTYLNYRYAELTGNYEGSFRNDNGQSDPFLTSLFDFPFQSAVDTNPTNDANGDGFPANDFNTSEGAFLVSETIAGQFNSGPLNTNRAHILNAFVSHQWDWGFNVGGRMNFRTGQPYGPLFAHPTYRNAGEIPGFNPVYWWAVGVDTTGDGATDNTGFYLNPDATLAAIPAGSTSTDGDPITGGIQTGPRLHSYDVVQRDFFGDTPAIVTFDLHAAYDINLRGGQSKITVIADIFNLFNTNNGLRFDGDVETRPGSPNVDFLKANGYQAPRSVRIGAIFTF